MRLVSHVRSAARRHMCHRGDPYGLQKAILHHARDFALFAKYVFAKGGSASNRLPIVLCNSYPKSGTHLLFQLLCAVPGLRPWHDIISIQSVSGLMNSANHLRWKFGVVAPGRVVRTHLPYCAEVLSVLRRRTHRRFFIYRDLRDTALSHAKWAHKEAEYFLNRYYTQHLATDEERLMASIVGVPVGTPFASNVSQPSIGMDFSRWKGWLKDPGTLSVRFEDLVGSRGRGDDRSRISTVRRILVHLGVQMTDSEIERTFSTTALDPSTSHTFRRGQIGSWRDAFTADHKRAFKAVAGSLLVELGYEKGHDW